jgi:hypothetical protein
VKKFEDIADETTRLAGNIKCSLEEYVEGLDLIIERLQEEKQAAKESM